jgi:hypothetical protein
MKPRPRGMRSWDSSVVIALGYRLDDRGFDSLQRLRIFLFTTTSRPALGPTQSPIQCVSRVLSLGVKRSRREADHSHPSSADVKNSWRYTSIPLMCLPGVVISQSTAVCNWETYVGPNPIWNIWFQPCFMETFGHAAFISGCYCVWLR